MPGTPMRQINLATVVRDVVRRCNKLLLRTGTSILLSPPSCAPRLSWYDESLETLLERLALRASSNVDQGSHVRITVSQRRNMRGLEGFFDIRPSHWILLKIARKGRAGFETEARNILEDLGYRCDEWIGTEGSWPQMGAFSSGKMQAQRLMLWAQWYKNTQKYELIIPVVKPSP